MTNSVDTFLQEGKAFAERHPDTPEIGGWAWGLLRAVMECPNCPGHFRVPLDKDWKRIACPNCKNVWERKDD